MSTQDSSKQSLAHSNEKKGKRKSRHCDLKDQEGVVCDDERHGASFVSDRVIIPNSSKHLDLVGKALCRKHYNKLIVNAKKIKTNYVCSHPKHQVYMSSARSSTETKTFIKVPERLIKCLEIEQGTMICRRCLYKTDDDPVYVRSPNYLPPPERISKEYIRNFQGRSYVLRNDIIYSQSEFQELESAYHELCAELDETKLG